MTEGYKGNTKGTLQIWSITEDCCVLGSLRDTLGQTEKESTQLSDLQVLTVTKEAYSGLKESDIQKNKTRSQGKVNRGQRWTSMGFTRFCSKCAWVPCNRSSPGWVDKWRTSPSGDDSPVWLCALHPYRPSLLLHPRSSFVLIPETMNTQILRKRP